MRDRERGIEVEISVPFLHVSEVLVYLNILHISMTLVDESPDELRYLSLIHFV